MPKLKVGTIIPTPEEDALINAGIALDPDTYELSSEEFRQLKPMRGRPAPRLAPLYDNSPRTSSSWL